jgi:hypothetical protein
MQRLADLSHQAVGLIRDARTTPNLSELQTMQREAAYLALLNHMYDEARQALENCREDT